MDVAETLRSARRRSGLSQHAVAERAGVTRVEVSRWERGLVVPSAEAFLRVLGACEVATVHVPQRHGAEGASPARPAVMAPPAMGSLCSQAPVDESDRVLIDAQLARTPEQRLHLVEELARLRAAARP
jgi:transcriptional regulator with XRE-family HTH domain